MPSSYENVICNIGLHLVQWLGTLHLSNLLVKATISASHNLEAMFGMFALTSFSPSSKENVNRPLSWVTYHDLRHLCEVRTNSCVKIELETCRCGIGFWDDLQNAYGEVAVLYGSVTLWVNVYRRYWDAMEYNHSAGRIITPQGEFQILKSLSEIDRLWRNVISLLYFTPLT